MAVLFQGKPGEVIALNNASGDLGLPLTIDGIAGSWFPQFTSILTDISVVLDSNYQTTHTCKDVIDIYVFGDRVSQMRIGGLAFAGRCDGGTASGLELILEWYRTNRIAVRESPIQVQIGTTAAGRFRGNLVRLAVDIAKAEARISQFSLFLEVFPGD